MFAYVGARSTFLATEDAAGQWQNALSDGYLGFWLAGAALCLVPVALWHARTAPAASRRVAFIAALLFAVGLYSTLAPRRPSTHHLQFLPLPLLWLTGTVLALAWPAGGLPPGAAGETPAPSPAASCFAASARRAPGGSAATIRMPRSTPRGSARHAASSRISYGPILRAANPSPSGAGAARCMWRPGGGRPRVRHRASCRSSRGRTSRISCGATSRISQPPIRPCSPMPWGRAISPSINAPSLMSASRLCATGSGRNTRWLPISMAPASTCATTGSPPLPPRRPVRH